MEPHVADLIDALPEETKRSESASPQVSLQGLLGKLGQRSVPVGRLNRARIFGTLQAKIAAAYLAYWLRSAYKGIDEKQQRLNETHLKAALELLAGMSYLRGAVMKMGQMIANYPHVAPEEFAQVFGVLHFEAPPMHFSLLREFVRNELGADPQELFDDFETKAFAAASLGQVHRARLKGSGERVAIKIQYPSIARTIRDDLGNLRALLLPMRLSGNWDNLKLQFEGVCRMLERETDYQQEADDLRRARSAFEDDTGILVPKVYEEVFDQACSGHGVRRRGAFGQIPRVGPSRAGARPLRKKDRPGYRPSVVRGESLVCRPPSGKLLLHAGWAAGLG